MANEDSLGDRIDRAFDRWQTIEGGCGLLIAVPFYVLCLAFIVYALIRFLL